MKIFKKIINKLKKIAPCNHKYGAPQVKYFLLDTTGEHVMTTFDFICEKCSKKTTHVFTHHNGKGGHVII